MIKEKIIFGVKKFNFIIYTFLIFVSCTLIGLSFYYNYLKNNAVFTLLISLGCGLFSSVLLAFLIDLANEKRKNNTKEFVRDNRLWGLPIGVYWIAHPIVEKFCDNTVNYIGTMRALLDESLRAMAAIEPQLNTPEQIAQNIEKRQKLLADLKYGIDLYNDGYDRIAKNDYLLVKDGMFSQDEILTLKTGYDNLKRLSVYARWAELSDEFKNIFESLCDIKEIEEKLNTKVMYHANSNYIEDLDFTKKRNDNKETMAFVLKKKQA